MRLPTRSLSPLLFALALLAAPAAAQEEGKAVTGPGLAAIELEHEAIELRFAAPMVTWAGRDAEVPIRITPALDCRWWWADDVRLRCTPDSPGGSPLKAATRYRIEIGAGLWLQSGEAFAPSHAEADHALPRLSAGLEWPEDGGRPQLWVDGGEGVDAAAVAAVLELDFDGRPLRFRLEPAKQRWSPHRLRVIPDAWPTAPGELRLSVRPGLRSSAGPLRGTGQPALLVRRINEPFAFIDWRCQGAWWDDTPTACAAERPIVLRFNRALSDAAVAAIAEALPAGARIADEPTPPCYVCYREGLAPLRTLAIVSDPREGSLRFVLPAGLTAVDGAALATAVTVEIGILDPEPAYRVEPPLSVDAAVVKPSRVEGRNLVHADEWIELAVGERIELRRARLTPPAQRNVWAELGVPAPLAWLSRGGLSLGGPRERADVARATAVAPFQLLTWRSGEELLVWTSEWTDAKAVAGAGIELLRVDDQGGHEVLAQGRSGADGLTRLRAPAEKLRGWESDAMLLVRARAGRRTVVVPAIENRVPLPGSGWRPQAANQVAFGSSDRLLYRPGETVKFRLWLRNRVDNHLRAPAPGTPVTLSLRAGWNPPLQRWNSGTDDFGGVTGELELPASTPDGQWCIGPEHSMNEGACFLVTRFQAQSMWAALSAEPQRVRPGEEIVLGVEGGFYSGGSAAHAGLRLTGFASAESFAQSHPEYREFTFAGGAGEPETELFAGLALPARLDGEGRAVLAVRAPARIEVRGSDEEAPAQALPFARLRFNAYLAMAGEAEIAAPTAVVDYAAFPAYVGLRSEGWWLSQDADPVLEAVVVAADGTSRGVVPVQVRIERDVANADDEDAASEIVGRCSLVAGTAAPCAFRAPDAGLYRFIAEAGDAAPTTLMRWIGRSPPPDQDTPALQLRVERPAGLDGSPAQLRLSQPHGRATALMTLEYGGLRRAWIEQVDGDGLVAIALPREWAPAATLRVVLRPHTADVDAALAQPTLQASIDLDIPAPPARPPQLTLAEPSLAPGATQRLTVRNDAAVARQFVVAVVDDSLHQQAAALHPRLDPGHEGFLGSLRRWQIGELHELRGWSPRNLFFDPDAEQRSRGESERARDGFPPAPAVAAPAPPPPPSAGLDTIEVSGSRLKRSEIEPDQAGGEPLSGGSRDGAADPRVRHRFADAAYWNDGLLLGPGESREIALPLPDNLTRWRVLVWAADVGDEIAFAETTFTASLPVELRLGLPSRLFADDAGEATVNVRAVGAPALLRLHAEASGAGADARLDEQVRAAADAVVARVLGLQPDRAGEIALYARADADRGSDAIAGRVRVQSPWGPRSRVQAGWMQPTLSLPVPALPEGAREGELSVAVSLGGASWRALWLDGLRAYPHRCWEQQLSRAIGAALALQDEAGLRAWPDAAAELEAVLTQAPRFRDDNGWYHYFAENVGQGSGPGSLLLSVHTLRGYGRLRALGAEVPDTLVTPLRDLVSRSLVARQDNVLAPYRGYAGETLAVAVAALTATGGGVPQPVLDRLWRDWDELGWHARSELVRALAATGDGRAGEGLGRLREAGVDHGLRRVLADPRSFGWAMGSPLRDQCAVTATLFELDRDPAHLRRRQAFLRGTADLYAGEARRSVDTQAALHCLLALQAADAAMPADTAPVVEVRAGDSAAQLAVTPTAPRAEWRAPAVAGPLQMRSAEDADATLSYVARLDWHQDLRSAQPEAVGMQLERRYAVLRDGRWTPLSAEAPEVRVGDWVRVSLQLQVPAVRHFVAITDVVPGGWISRDLALAGTAGDDLRRLAGGGSWWFDSRQTGADEVRLYAQWLPPGRHEVHYFVQATHAGRYFAAPAVAELMYGEASQASTAGAQVRIRQP